MTRYELSDGKSHKFWAIERDGKTLRVRYGRIGTDGQALAKSFATPALAEKEEAKLAAEKTKKGYRAARGKGAGPKASSKAAPASDKAAVDEKALMTPIGRVRAESNFIALVAIDGSHASAYRFPFDEEEEGHLDFDATLDGPLPIGRGEGLIVDMGSSGFADIYRFGGALVLADLAEGEDDVDAEAEKLRAIAGHPTTKPKRIGRLDVPSGVLVLMGQHDQGPQIDLAKVKKSGTVKTKSGAAIAVAPGRYEIWREEFYRNPIRGRWGLMESRVRVVAAGTKLAPGKPIVDLSTAPKAHAPATGNHRYVDAKKKWVHSRTITCAPDGRVFAGQDDGYGVAAWNADGTLAWQLALGKPKLVTVQSEVTVQLVGEDLLVLGPSSGKLLVLDPRTGKTRRTLKIPSANFFRVIGDLLFVLHQQETRVLRYPSLKPVVKLVEYRNSFQAALSPHGRFFVSSTDDETHVYDAKKWKLLRTIDGDVSAAAFTTDGKLLLGSRKSNVRIVDPKTGKKLATFDAAKDRSRKPPIEAIACTPKHIAVSRVDGTTALFEAKTRKLVTLFEKHTTQNYFGPPIVFSNDGTRLWVGACPKGGKAGLSGYDVSGL